MLTFIPAPHSEVVRTSCLCVWLAELEVNGLATLDSSCDLDDSAVGKSIFRFERTLPCLESLEFVSDLEIENLRCNKRSYTHLVVLALCTYFSW